MNPNKRVLIVEDEWIVAEDHAMIFRDAGFGVVGPASTVAQAMELIDQQDIDVATLDVSLADDEASYPVAERLVNLGVPFLFLSGYLNHDLPEEYRQQQVLSKPTTPEQLVRAVRSLLGKPPSA